MALVAFSSEIKFSLGCIAVLLLLIFDFIDEELYHLRALQYIESFR